MKELVFRPLRRVKKSGKVTVAAYPQWRRLMTADYAAFRLVVDNEYTTMAPDELVYNHEGKPLFWRDFDPAQIPVYTSEEMRVFEIEIADLFQHRPHHGMRWAVDSPRIHYCVQGLDCDGVPTFSHLTIEEVAEHYTNYRDFEPLTVSTVRKWLGWLLCQLQNTDLQIGK